MVPPTTTHNELVAAMRNGKPYIHKSDRLRQAEDRIMSAAARLRPSKPLDGPLRLTVRWCFPEGGRGAHRAGEPHVSKPDMSNMLKTLEDCLVRVGVMSDDSLICEERLSKGYAEVPGIFVIVEQLGGGGTK
jgi:Holliday junction resolvase RusA-like endonuclease